MEVSGVEDGMTRRQNNLIVVATLGLFSAGIRLLAARSAYPACGDAGHFVQHGVALANGVPGAMSTYWSQGMIAIAAAAVKLGLDPRYAMQATTLVSGVAVVLLFLGVVWRLTGSRGMALIGGVILAVNPTMVQYSITGYSEMPYMAFLMTGVWVSLSPCVKPLLTYGLAGALIGVGGYFKGLDAAVAACGLGLFVLFQKSEGWRNKMTYASAVPVMAFVVLLPLCIFTYANSGSFTPGSKGGRAFLALGSDWADSKKVYAADGLQLEKSSSADIMRQMPSRVISNAKETFRIFNRQIFIKGLQMGTILFFLVLARLALSLWQERIKETLLPLCLLLLQMILLWLVLLHNRVLMPSLPWVVLLFLLASQTEMWRACIKSFGRGSVSIILLIFLSVNLLYSQHAFASEFVWWRYANTKTCAKILKAHGGTDKDVVMHYGPQLAVEFNKTNPLKTVEVPYGTIEQVSEVADKFNVRFIVISDSFRSHWPVARLFDEGISAPENWVLLEELIFPKEEWTGWSGHPGERCRIYERRNAASSDMRCQ
ncbi:MAG: hypothetical protein GX803_04180 [Lentisphaerae bacterium]|nr:hypothetical protein [Lentisphaerota bacterium]